MQEIVEEEQLIIFFNVFKVVNGNQSVSYVWQLKCNIANSPPLSCTFNIHYQATAGEDLQTYHCSCGFMLENYQVRHHCPSQLIRDY